MKQFKVELDKLGKLLGRKYRRKLLWLILAQFFLSLFDLLFIATISLAVYAFTDLQSTYISIPAASIQLKIDASSLVTLLLLSAFIRSLGSLLVQRKSNQYFAIREAEISTTFASQYFEQKWDQKTHSHSSNFLQVYASLITSVFNMIFRQTIQQFAEIFSLCAIVVGLVIVKPELASAIVCYFFVISIIILKFTIPRLQGIGLHNRELARENLKSILEAQTLSMEKSVSQRGLPILRNLYTQRLQIGMNAKEQSYLQSIPRHMLDLGLILGLSIALYIANMIEDQSGVLETIALVAAASFRIIPSINSIAVGYGNLKNALPYLERVMTTAAELGVDFEALTFSVSIEKYVSRHFTGDLVLENVTYKYPGAEKPIIENFNLHLPANKTLYITGESGTGKSTLLMLIVGFLEPQAGKVYESFNGEATRMAMDTSGICFLGQEFALLDDTFARNIALRDTTEIDTVSLRAAAQSAGIMELIDSLPDGFNMKIGEHGNRLSRGEKQRLGLARAIFSNPQLIILDEPTSNLDKTNEKIIWDSLRKLHGKTSLILVSHRKPPADIIDFSIDLGPKNISVVGK
jgi:ABC-type multidrug transport system fused ATPase/permease subunit